MHELTARQVETARPPDGKKESYLYDGGNLALRVRQTQTQLSKAWLFKYTFAGKREGIYIGDYPSISLADARKIAAEHRELLARGTDPKTHVERKKAEALAHHLATQSGEVPVTLRDMFNRWDNEYLKHKYGDGGAYVRALFENHVFAHGLGDMHLTLLRPSHISGLLNKMRDGGVTRTCGVALSNLRQMFTWATPYEWVLQDPTRGLKAENWDGLAVERKRVLSEAEIRQLHKKLHKSELADRWKHAIWVILATGTRVEETLLAERSHIDLEKRTWVIPAENQKQIRGKVAEPHIIHLSDFALVHMKALLKLPGTEKYVFPARGRLGGKPGPANHKTLSHAVRDRQLGEGEDVQVAGRTKETNALALPRGQWTPHDLRRTMSTLMQELRIPPDIIDRCQNHVIEGKVRRTYLRSELLELTSEAWDALGTLLARLTAEAEVERKIEEDREKYGDDI